MDAIFYYRLMDAVRDSLDRAGRQGYTLYRAEGHEVWLDLVWLQEYLDATGHESVPLMWDGRALSVHDVVKVHSRSSDRELWRFNRTGEILLRDDALIAAVTFLADDGMSDTVVVVGERSGGALQRLVDDFGRYSRQ